MIIVTPSDRALIINMITIQYIENEIRVGHMTIDINKEAHKACIDNLFIEKPFRGNNMATKLWEKARVQLIGLGITQVDLDAWDNIEKPHTLQKLYESWGFGLKSKRYFCDNQGSYWIKHMRFLINKST